MSVKNKGSQNAQRLPTPFTCKYRYPGINHGSTDSISDQSRRWQQQCHRKGGEAEQDSGHGGEFARANGDGHAQSRKQCQRC